jgi:parallel beta-helix repeat protein
MYLPLCKSIYIDFRSGTIACHTAIIIGELCKFKPHIPTFVQKYINGGDLIMKRMRRSTIIPIFIILIASFSFTIHLPQYATAQGTPVNNDITVDTLWTLLESPYWIEDNITILPGVNLTIEPGVDIRFNGFHGLFVEGNLIALGTEAKSINFTSNKSSPNLSDWDRIQINSTGHIEMDYCNVSFGDYGLYLISSDNNVSDSNISNNNQGLVVSYYSNNNSILRNNASNNIFGVTLRWANNNTIIDNQMWNNSFWNLYIFGWKKEHYNHTVATSNIINGKPIYYFFDLKDTVISGIETSQVTVAGSDNITLLNVNVTNGDYIYLVFTSNSTVQDSYGSNNSYGFFSKYSTDTVIINNTFINNRNDMYIDTSSGLSITNNIGGTMALDGSSNNDILMNKINEIQLYLSENNTLDRNDITASDVYGIYLSQSSNNSMNENEIVDQGVAGIHLSFSSNNSIMNNSVSHSWYGLRVWQNSNNNSIKNNTISDNGFGINLWGSLNNHVFHNNIINNTLQASDDSDNFWNDTYPFGGNYWSDYSSGCQDLYDGPITPQLAGLPDNICDIQNDIDADTIDYYPQISIWSA